MKIQWCRYVHRTAACFVLAVLSACGGGGGGEPASPDGGGPPPGGGGAVRSYSVGGEVVGMPIPGQVAVDVSGQRVLLTGDGRFSAATPLADGSNYVVTVTTAAAGRRCTVVGGSGVVSGADVTSVRIDCSVELNVVPNGPVQHMAVSQDGRRLFIAGQFTRIGRPTGSFVPTDPESGQMLALSQEIYGRIDRAISDGQGGYIVVVRSLVERAIEYGDIVQMRRIDASGRRIGSFAPPAHPNYQALHREGDVLYVGGSSGTIGIHRVVALNVLTGALVPGFQPVVINGAVHELTMSQGVLYVGGQFVSVNGAARQSLAAVDGATGALLPFAVSSSYNTGIATINQLAAGADVLYLGGVYDRLQGSSRRGLAAVRTSTGELLPWEPQGVTYGPGSIHDMVVADEGLWIAGSLTASGRSGVLVVDPSTGALGNWGAAFEGGGDTTVVSMSLTNDKVYVAGRFGSVNSQPRGSVAALSRSTAAVLGYGVGHLDSDATVVLAAADKVWVGGRFQLYGGEKRRGLAALSIATGQLEPWTPEVKFEGNPSSSVYALVPTGRGLLISGGFDAIGVAPRNGLAVLDEQSGAATDWDAALPPGTSAMYLAASADRIYVAGSFTAVQGQLRSSMAAFERSSMALTTWAPSASAFGMTGLSANATRVFLAAGNVLSAFDAATGNLAPWRQGLPNPAGYIDQLLATDSTVYIRGNFSSFDGRPVLWGQVALSADSGVFQHEYLMDIERFVLGRGQVFAQTISTTAEGIVSSVVSPLDGLGGLGNPIASVDGVVDTFAFDGSQLFLGGNIGRDGVPRQNLVFVRSP